ncbi:hypothetical protein J6590_006195 [Homalodisca vitripennis]|nr:hypothetical protein J6590_101689 [Homalodisca vitripennis]KAG8328017.1 hypothetical protein J6590_006195 [Homalodisca vitripennis]
MSEGDVGVYSLHVRAQLATPHQISMRRHQKHGRRGYCGTAGPGPTDTAIIIIRRQELSVIFFREEFSDKDSLETMTLN